MFRKIILSAVSLTALAVGTIAVISPGTLLAGKGIVANPAAEVWMRQVGVLLIPLGLIAFWVRGHKDSPTLRAVLLGNLLIQAGMFPVEIIAYRSGVIPRLSGIVPNSALHVILACGLAFVVFGKGARAEVAEGN
ncbi:MAG: hypothetical protein ABI036_20585 [Fibrobacteria bacterium]